MSLAKNRRREHKRSNVDCLVKQDPFLFIAIPRNKKEEYHIYSVLHLLEAPRVTDKSFKIPTSTAATGTYNSVNFTNSFTDSDVRTALLNKPNCTTS